VRPVGARFRDDVHLAAGAGAEFRRVVVRLDAELLHVLEACLQLEGRRHFAVQIAGRRVDDRRALDAVVTDRVLLDGAPAEPDVLPGAGARVLRAGRLQHQLRHLPAVHGQVHHLALADVDADTRGAQVDRVDPSLHGHGLGETRWLQRQIERELLRRRQRQAGEFERREIAERHADGVDGRLQVRDDVAPLLVGGDRPLLARALVLDDDHGTGNESARLIDDRA
jgi:hypothetical protein